MCFLPSVKKGFGFPEGLWSTKRCTVPPAFPQTYFHSCQSRSTIAITFFFEEDRNGLGSKIRPPKTIVSGLFAVGMTTIAFPGTGLGRLSTMITAVVFSTLRDRLAGIYLALTSFVCTIFECHMMLLLANQICQSNISHERNCSVMLIPNTPCRQKAEDDQSPSTAKHFLFRSKSVSSLESLSGRRLSL